MRDKLGTERKMGCVMREITLPEEFVSYPEARKQAFLRLKELKEQGRRVVGIFCTYTPLELIDAAGATPVVLCGIGEENIPAAEQRLPKNLCPLIKASYGGAVTDHCPFFYFSDMVLAESTCDGKKKMYELLNELKHTYVMQLPPGRNGALAAAFWRQEVQAAKEDLERFFGVVITEEALRRAIHLRNRERQAILHFYELGRLKPSPLSGFELNTVTTANDYAFDLEAKIAMLEQRTRELQEYYRRELQGKPSRPRILITGCPTNGLIDKVVKRIEELGADVVCFDNCCGPREKKDLIDETKEPITAIAEKYLRIDCSVMSPNPGRLETIKQQIDDYQIDGVIEVLLTACHTYAVESDLVRRCVSGEKGIPFLSITTDYSPTDQGQLDTRIGAFIELLG